MVIKNARLITTAVDKKGYPDTLTPEVAFIGRSNVGKSSLINALAGRKALARSSGSPGKTRTINFFGMDDFVIFVDLPGYGYAKASKKEIAAWGPMAENYLKDRSQLKGAVFLLDLRRVPSQDDIMMYDWLLYFNINVIIAATKSDKLNRREAEAGMRLIKGLFKKDAVMFSSVIKTGRCALWEAIQNLL